MHPIVTGNRIIACDYKTTAAALSAFLFWEFNKILRIVILQKIPKLIVKLLLQNNLVSSFMMNTMVTQ